MRTETHLHFCRRVCTLSQRERILAKTMMRKVMKTEMREKKRGYAKELQRIDANVCGSERS